MTNDKELEEIASKVAKDKNNQFALKNFERNYDDLSPFDLHEYCEALLRGLYLNRKNVSLYFTQGLNFLLSHPNLSLLDHNVPLTEHRGNPQPLRLRP